MPTIEFRIDIGGTDLLPHTFIVIDNGSGDVHTYGFGPANGESLSGPGIIKDDEVHEYQYTTGPIEVTPEQYNRMVEYVTNSIENPPDYNFWKGFIDNNPNQCSQWAIAVAQAGGLNWGWFTWNPYGQAIYIEFNKILDSFRNLFTTALTSPAPRRDPLILDLDNDGTETIAVENGPYFDHDANGFAEQTGWVSPDDGLLVRDINNNGTIDNGRELFGDNTLLKDGTLATDGLQALADLDDNADGKVDASDSSFNQLRVWKDANSDGISQAGELKTLNEFGIKSLNTEYTVTNITDSTGNTQTHQATYEKVLVGETI